MLERETGRTMEREETNSPPRLKFYGFGAPWPASERRPERSASERRPVVWKAAGQGCVARGMLS